MSLQIARGMCPTPATTLYRGLAMKAKLGLLPTATPCRQQSTAHTRRKSRCIALHPPPHPRGHRETDTLRMGQDIITWSKYCGRSLAKS